MKILAAGDIHGDFSIAEALANKAQKENVDLVILCGDIVNPQQNPNYVIKAFLKKNKKVVFIPGNHESFATANFIAELYKIRNIHGAYLNYEDLGIFACGGSNIGLEQLGEEEIFNILKKSHEKIKHYSKKLMITHVHPTNTKIELFSKFIPGSIGVEKAVKELQPDILLCSHVHEAEGIEEILGNTKIINVGRKGKVIEI